VSALLSNSQLAERLGITAQYGRILRMTGRGPKFLRLGGPTSRAYYTEEDVAEWIASKPRYVGTQDEKRAAHAAAQAAKPNPDVHSSGRSARGAGPATTPRRRPKK